MNPGILNKRIKFMKFLETSDGAGGFTDNFTTGDGWQEICEVWAYLSNDISTSNKNLEMAQQAMSEHTHKITIRYRSDVNRSMAIKYKNRRFEIAEIININEENRWLKLLCIERD